MSISRMAGVTLPLACLRSERDWGIGEIGDLTACAEWLKSAGFRLMQLLPIHELAEGENSPYAARTAFGLDPIFLSLSDLSDLTIDPQAPASFLGADAERERQRLRSLPNVDFRAVRALKEKALAVAWENFHEREWSKKTERARELESFIANEASWENDLALYVAIREEQNLHGWETWPAPLRYRDPASLDDARKRLEMRILRHHYEQWQLAKQWGDARRKVESMGMALMGDLPFVVGRESADVWASSRLFREGVSLGAPPDEFAPGGQDWGLPPYHWSALAETDYAWLRARVHHASRLYHAFRLDHVVGFFRQYVRLPKEQRSETSPPGEFDPASESEQEAHGKLMLDVMKGATGGADLIAEDLGVIPNFVRTAMRERGIPGYKVILWERDPSGKLLDTVYYDESSVATWSTHDTLPIGAWWDELSDQEKGDVAQLCFQQGGQNDHGVNDMDLFALLFRAKSRLALVLITELLGQKDRLNTPGTVGDHNWTYRMPKDFASLYEDGDMRKRLADFAKLIQAAARA